MVKKASILMILMLLPITVFATAQIPDSIIYKGETYSLFSEPLEMYFSDKLPRPNDIFVAQCSACWRGYVANWEIREGYLYLSRLHEGTCGLDSKEIAIERIFPEQRSPVKAIWFSGELRIPQGKQLRYVHMGYGSVYEREMIITIKNGKILDERIIDNTKQGLPPVKNK